MEGLMSDETYDDGLVHGHVWPQTQAPVGQARQPAADASGARVPSTVVHDDRLYCDC
jgi:hypothetical protein